MEVNHRKNSRIGLAFSVDDTFTFDIVIHFSCASKWVYNLWSFILDPLFMYCKISKFLDRNDWANSADPDLTALE